MDTQRLRLQRDKRVLTRLEALQTLTHAVKRPEQIDRGRPRIGQHLKIRIQRFMPVAAGGDPRARAEHHAIGRADANSRRPTHHHRANRLGHGCCGMIGMPGFLERQHTLVEQMQGAISPINGLNLLRR
ncbi:hypothetical protein D9M68_854550 [compost metagenome]